MTIGEQLYLVMVIAAIGGFAAVLGYFSHQYTVHRGSAARPANTQANTNSQASGSTAHA